MHQRVAMAIEAVKRLDPGYWAATLEQRLPPGGAGSIISGFGSPEMLEKALLEAAWEPYQHPALMAGCVAFVTQDVQGHLGVVSLDSLDDTEVLVADDRKLTGTVSCTVKGALGPLVEYTVVILGPEGEDEIVYTFHPGEPTVPAGIATTAVAHGQQLSVAEARKLGFLNAKIV